MVKYHIVSWLLLLTIIPKIGVCVSAAFRAHLKRAVVQYRPHKKLVAYAVLLVVRRIPEHRLVFVDKPSPFILTCLVQALSPRSFRPFSLSASAVEVRLQDPGFLPRTLDITYYTKRFAACGQFRWDIRNAKLPARRLLYAIRTKHRRVTKKCTRPIDTKMRMTNSAKSNLFCSIHAMSAISTTQAFASSQIRLDEAETQLLDSLRHPNIVRVTDCGTTSDGHPWYAMDLIDDDSLAVRMSQPNPPSSDEIARWYGEIGSNSNTICPFSLLTM